MQKRTRTKVSVFELDLGQEIGKKWEDVRITPIGLTLPGFKRPFDIDDLKSVFWGMQRMNLLEWEINRLRKERNEAWERAEKAEDRAEYYRRQLKLESSAGSMLARIFSTEKE